MRGSILVKWSNMYYHELKSKFSGTDISVDIDETVKHQDRLILSFSIGKLHDIRIDMIANYESNNGPLDDARAVVFIQVPVTNEEKLKEIVEQFKELLPELQIITKQGYHYPHSSPYENSGIEASKGEKTARISFEIAFKDRNNYDTKPIAPYVEALKKIDKCKSQFFIKEPSPIALD